MPLIDSSVILCLTAVIVSALVAAVIVSTSAAAAAILGTIALIPRSSLSQHYLPLSISSYTPFAACDLLTRHRCAQPRAHRYPASLLIQSLPPPYYNPRLPSIKKTPINRPTSFCFTQFTLYASPSMLPTSFTSTLLR